MKISIPCYFQQQNSFPGMSAEDITMVDYRTRSSRETVYAKSDSHLLVFVAHGTKVVRFSGAEIDANKNDILFIRKGHYVMHQISDMQHSGYESLVITLSDAFIAEFYMQYADKITTRTRFTPAPRNSNSYCKQAASAALGYTADGLILCLQDLIQKPSAYIVKLKVYEMLLHMLEDSTGCRLAAMLEEIQNTAKYDIQTYMLENFHQPVSISDHAQNLGMSLTTFKRHFKTCFNDTPQNWINKMRLEHAVSMLRCTSYSITEICFLCGFGSMSHCMLLFRQQYGQSPGQYRATGKTALRNNNLAL